MALMKTFVPWSKQAGKKYFSHGLLIDSRDDNKFMSLKQVGLNTNPARFTPAPPDVLFHLRYFYNWQYQTLATTDYVIESFYIYILLTKLKTGWA